MHAAIGVSDGRQFDKQFIIIIIALPHTGIPGVKENKKKRLIPEKSTEKTPDKHTLVFSSKQLLELHACLSFSEMELSTNKITNQTRHCP